MLNFASYHLRNRIRRITVARMAMARIPPALMGRWLSTTTNLHGGVGGAKAAKELAVDCRDLLPILFTG